VIDKRYAVRTSFRREPHPHALWTRSTPIIPAPTRIVVHRMVPTTIEARSRERGAPRTSPIAVPIGGANTSGDTIHQPTTPYRTQIPYSRPRPLITLPP